MQTELIWANQRGGRSGRLDVRGNILLAVALAAIAYTLLKADEYHLEGHLSSIRTLPKDSSMKVLNSWPIVIIIRS